MAIALDTVSSRQASDGTGNPLTFSYTCTGSNLILFVGVNADSNTLTGATYNGVAMTEVGNVQTPASRWNYLYMLIGPATGAHNVVVSTSGATTIIGYAISYTGAKQSGQPDASSTNTGTAVTTLTTSVTTIEDNCWTVATSRTGPLGYPCSGGAGTTMRSNGVNADDIGDSNGALTPPGSKSLIFNPSSATNIGMVMCSFAPALAVATKNFALLGVG